MRPERLIDSLNRDLAVAAVEEVQILKAGAEAVVDLMRMALVVEAAHLIGARAEEVVHLIVEAVVGAEVHCLLMAEEEHSVLVNLLMVGAAPFLSLEVVKEVHYLKRELLAGEVGEAHSLERPCEWLVYVSAVKEEAVEQDLEKE